MISSHLILIFSTSFLSPDSFWTVSTPISTQCFLLALCLSKRSTIRIWFNLASNYWEPIEIKYFAGAQGYKMIKFLRSHCTMKKCTLLEVTGKQILTRETEWNIITLKQDFKTYLHKKMVTKKKNKWSIHSVPLEFVRQA